MNENQMIAINLNIVFITLFEPTNCSISNPSEHLYFELLSLFKISANHLCKFSLDLRLVKSYTKIMPVEEKTKVI